MASEPEIPRLDSAERLALVAEWKRQQQEPPPRDRRTTGCATMVVALALALSGPTLLRLAGFELPRPLMLVAAAVLALVFLVGTVLGLFAGSGLYAHDLQRAEQALAWLAANPDSGDAAMRRREVVALLLHAYCTDGPSTVNTIDFGKARERLGAALPWVIAAERALKTDLGIYAVFTDSKVRLPG